MDHPHCKQCKAMCYADAMVQGLCVPCARRYVKKLETKLSPSTKR